MKKNLMLIPAFVLAAVLLLTACNSHSNDPEPDNGKDTTTIPKAGCKLVNQSTNVIASSPQYFQLEYDASGNPAKISYGNNGATKLVETVQPTGMVIKEATQNTIYRSTAYDASYLDKLPKTAVIRSDETARVSVFAYTYDSKNRLATITGGQANSDGVLIEPYPITITFTYNDNNDVTKFTYQTKGEVYQTFTATGFDGHLTPYSRLKNSSFLQYDFYWFSTDLTNPRYVFDHLSAHNVLGFTLQVVGVTSVYTETYNYTYNAEGQPTQRDASLGNVGEAPTKKFFDAWTYECQ